MVSKDITAQWFLGEEIYVDEDYYEDYDGVIHLQYGTCSNCNEEFVFDENTMSTYSYCPHCGAKFINEDE